MQLNRIESCARPLYTLVGTVNRIDVASSIYCSTHTRTHIHTYLHTRCVTALHCTICSITRQANQAGRQAVSMERGKRSQLGCHPQLQVPALLSGSFLRQATPARACETCPGPLVAKSLCWWQKYKSGKNCREKSKKKTRGAK